jgi:hypothetical protein
MVQDMNEKKTTSARRLVQQALRTIRGVNLELPDAFSARSGQVKVTLHQVSFGAAESEVVRDRVRLAPLAQLRIGEILLLLSVSSGVARGREESEVPRK